MPLNLQVRRLTQPTKTELNLLAKYATQTFQNSPIARLATGDNEALHYIFHKATLASMARVGHLLVASHEGQDIGCIVFFPPGTEILGDDEQRSYGFNDYMATLSDEVRWKFREWMSKYNATADALLGLHAKKKFWSMSYLTVSSKYPPDEVARVLYRAGETLVEADRSSVIVESLDRGLFEHWGYTAVGEGTLDMGERLGEMSFFIMRKDFMDKPMF